MRALPELIDFGVLNSADAVGMHSLKLISYVTPPIGVLEVRAQRQHQSLRMRATPSHKKEGSQHFAGVLQLQPRVETEIVQITFSARVQGDFSGIIVVKTNHPTPALGASASTSSRLAFSPALRPPPSRRSETTTSSGVYMR